MNNSQISQSLTNSLSLRQAPVAISFAQSIPPGTRAHSGRVAAGCRFWEEAAVTSFATSASDHDLCAIGVYTHNLQPTANYQTDLRDALAVFKDLGYVREEDLPSIPVVAERAKHVIYGPLAESTLPADVVLLFVNAAQTLILSEATGQVEGQSAPAMGRPACAVVPQVMNTGRAAFSLGCCGARSYLDNLDESTAIYAIPGAKLDRYASRIELLSKANAVLSRFHQIRRNDVDSGLLPTIKESLAALNSH